MVTSSKDPVPVTLQLPAAVEQCLRAAAARSGRTLEAFLADVAQEAAKANGAAHQPDVPVWERSADEQVAAWNRWCDSHSPVSHFVDDSRESIYAGRGE